jgi:ADP-heptose:LPS heptosyltransferase
LTRNVDIFYMYFLRDFFANAEVAMKAVKRVALVRLDNLGDFLLGLSAVRFYKLHFPDAEIVCMVGETVAAFAQRLPYWDRVIPVLNTWTDDPVLDPRVGSVGHFDIVVNLQYSRRIEIDRFVLRLSATRSMAVNCRGPNLSEQDYVEGNSFYTDLLPVEPEPKHEIIRNFEILAAITGTQHKPELLALNPFLPPEPHRLPERYVAIFPGASWGKKAYPWPRFVRVCQMIQEQFDLVPVLCGGVNDMALAANIERNATHGIINLVGQLDIGQSLAVIARAQFVIANDSMAAHASNLLCRPSVCIIGGGYTRLLPDGSSIVGRFLPYPTDLVSPDVQCVMYYGLPCWGCSYHCIYDSYARDCVPCVDYIPYSEFSESVKALAVRLI